MFETMSVDMIMSSDTWSSANDAFFSLMDSRASAPYSISGSVHILLICLPMSGVCESVSSFEENTASYSLLSASPMPAHSSCSGESAITAEFIKHCYHCRYRTEPAEPDIVCVCLVAGCEATAGVRRKQNRTDGECKGERALRCDVLCGCFFFHFLHHLS